MVIINVLSLIAVAFFIGYYLGKGKIEITQKVKLTKEHQERIEAMEHKQQQVIDDYNTALNELMRG